MAAYDLACIYSSLEDYEKALKYFEISLKRKDIDPYVSYTYKRSAASSIMIWGNEKESKRYAQMAIEAAENSQNPRVIAVMYISQADNLLEKNKLDEALALFEKNPYLHYQ